MASAVTAAILSVMVAAAMRLAREMRRSLEAMAVRVRGRWNTYKSLAADDDDGSLQTRIEHKKQEQTPTGSHL